MSRKILPGKASGKRRAWKTPEKKPGGSSVVGGGWVAQPTKRMRHKAIILMEV
jgi:hypothetical protein